MRIVAVAAVVTLLSFSEVAAEGLDAPTTRVEALRGKKFIRPVQHETMKRSELRHYLTQQIARSVGSTDKYRRILEMMQLVEPDPRLIETMLALYEAQVLAFYDPEKHTFYSLDTPPPGLAQNSYIDEVVTVHELTHAMQDQLFAAGDRVAAMQHDWDRELAYHALLEGEATLVMLSDAMEKAGQPLRPLLAESASLDMLTKAADTSSGVPADAPRFLVESMKFPYLDGLRFVAEAYRRDGWRGVDALHAHPPVSSEEILHPALYFARVGAKSTVASAALDRDAYFSTALGEFYWAELVGDAAAAGADRSTFTLREDRRKRLTAFIDSSWDTEQDALEFAEAYREFLANRNLKPEISVDGKRVRAAYGADTKAARRFVKM